MDIANVGDSVLKLINNSYDFSKFWTTFISLASIFLSLYSFAMLLRASDDTEDTRSMGPCISYNLGSSTPWHIPEPESPFI